MRFQTTDRPWVRHLSRSVRSVPTDLVVVAGLLLVINLAFRVPALREASIGGARLQALLGIPALLFVPGYLLVAAAFPARSGNELGARSIDGYARAALAFGMSVAVATLFGVALGTVWGFDRAVVLDGFTALVAVLLVAAAVRRFELPPRARFQVSLRRRARSLDDWIRRADSGREAIAGLALALAVLLAVGSIGYAVATPYTSGGSSTFYLATQNESGEPVAAGYPAATTAGESVQLVAGIENDEGARQAYTVVIAIERVADGDGSGIVESTELGRLHADVPAGEEWTARHAVAPEMTGEDLRLHYYLYRGTSAPDEPDRADADQDAYIWIDVRGA